MAYIDEGEGDPIVFLHGNPTSSFLWRNIMPHLEGRGRLIAPDLIGMGDSEKLDHSGPDSYTFVEHRKYLFALLEALDVHLNVTLVIHDWGSALGFHWAQEYPEKIKGIAFMEAIVAPIPTWGGFPEASRKVFQGFRSEAGEDMVLNRNIFVEAVLPGSILRDLTEAEMTEYRRPFLNPGEDRRPTLTWPRQIPLDGEPSEVVEEVRLNAEFHKESDIPKLFINADPGSILIGDQREFARSWKNQTEITVSGNHFIQEDSSEEIGAALRNFVESL